MKTLEDVNKFIEDLGYEEVVVFSNPDYASAFLGVSSNNCAVYSYVGMVQHLMEVDGMEEEEARDFIDYNTLGALGRDGDPIVLMDEVLPE